MDVSGLLKRLDREWQRLVDSIEGLPDDVTVQPGVVGDWSVKDVMGHITTWEEETLKALALMANGERPPRYGDINAFNARESSHKQGLSLKEIRRQLQETHHRLRAYVAAVPERLIATDTPFRRRLRMDTYSHYSEHYPQILSWRRSRGL